MNREIKDSLQFFEIKEMLNSELRTLLKIKLFTEIIQVLTNWWVLYVLTKL